MAREVPLDIDLIGRLRMIQSDVRQIELSAVKSSCNISHSL